MGKSRGKSEVHSKVWRSLRQATQSVRVASEELVRMLGELWWDCSPCAGRTRTRVGPKALRSLSVCVNLAYVRAVLHSRMLTLSRGVGGPLTPYSHIRS